MTESTDLSSALSFFTQTIRKAFGEMHTMGAVVALAVFCICPVFPQASTSLHGTVTDMTGAAVQGAELKLTHVATQATRTTTTAVEGTYSFVQLAPGTYELTATSTGFNEVQIRDIRLLVNQPGTQHIQFQRFGAVTDTITVSADAALLNTTDASLGNAFSSSQIVGLPLNARNAVGLLALQPGVLYIREDQAQEVSDARSGNVNGSRNDQSNITLDGVDVNEQMDRSPFSSVLRLPLDSVQEFRTTTLNATAELGRSSGAQIALVTKGGSNEVHGSAYWFHRNNVTSANEFFVKTSQLQSGAENKPPKLIRNIGGVSLGGPIVKNRWFLFGNWEHRRDASDESVLRFVPTAELRQGIVRYPDVNGNVVSVAPQQLASLIHSRGVNAAALDLMQQYPLPNTFTAGDFYNVAGYRFLAPISLRWNTYVARSDYNLDADGRHHLFVRGNLQNDREAGAPQFPGQAPNSVNLRNSKGIAVGLTSAVSPNFVNDFRYGLTRQGVETAGIATTPIVAFRNMSTLTGMDRSFRSLVPVHSLSNTSTWMKGNHALSFGTQIRFIRNHRLGTQNSFSGAFVNSSVLSDGGFGLSAPFGDLDPAYTGSLRDAVAAVMGLVTQGNAQYNYLTDGTVLPEGAPVRRSFNNNEYEFFVSDVWRVKPSLSITMGLRWSLMPPVEEANGQQLSSDIPLSTWFGLRGWLASQGRPQSEVPLISYLAKGDPNWRPLYAFHKKNFAPRIGVAWSPAFQDGLGRWLFGDAGKTTIRAGAGMFYDNYGQGILRKFDATAFGLSSSLQTTPGTYSVASAPGFMGLSQIPAGLLPAAPSAGFPALYPSLRSITNSVDDGIVPPYAITLNFNIGRDLGKGFFLQAGYVGRLGRRLLTQTDIAAPTNLKDAASGQTYLEAATALARLGLANTDVSAVQPMPFFENNYPNLAGGGLTATQAAYQYIAGRAPDYLTGLWIIDTFLAGAPSGNFSQFNPQYSFLSVMRNMSNSDYHAMQWNIRKQWSNGDLIDFNYTWSKSMDLSSVAERARATAGVIANPWNPGLLRAVSDFDTTHQFVASALYSIPVGKGARFLSGSGGLVDALLGGWQLGTIWRATSGFPVAPGNGNAWPTNWQLAGNARLVGAVPKTGGYNNAPSVTGGPNLFADPAAGLAAFDHELPGGVGVRNILRGDGLFQWDANLAKNFAMPWAESHRLQFRWEVFNLTNTVRFDVYAMSLNLANRATFGNYQSTLGAARTMQFGLRYTF